MLVGMSAAVTLIPKKGGELPIIARTTCLRKVPWMRLATSSVPLLRAVLLFLVITPLVPLLKSPRKDKPSCPRLAVAALCMGMALFFKCRIYMGSLTMCHTPVEEDPLGIILRTVCALFLPVGPQIRNNHTPWEQDPLGMTL